MRKYLCSALLLLAPGCYPYQYIVQDPLTAQEIIELTKSGESPESIIQKIDESRTFYGLDAENIIKLYEQGVDKAVIEHMRKTRERVYRGRSYYYGSPYHYPHYYHYPYPYFGFGFSGGYCW